MSTVCGRSDCQEPAAVQIIARSESRRTWAGQACEEHWAGTLAMIEDLGFVPFRSIDLSHDALVRPL